MHSSYPQLKRHEWNVSSARIRTTATGDYTITSMITNHLSKPQSTNFGSEPAQVLSGSAIMVEIINLRLRDKLTVQQRAFRLRHIRFPKTKKVEALNGDNEIGKYLHPLFEISSWL